MTWQIAVSGLWGLIAAFTAYVLLDSAVRWVKAYRAVRRQLEDIRNDI